MSLNAGSVFADLKLTIEGFTQNLQKAKGQLENFGGGISSSFNSLESGFNKINSGFSNLSGIFFNLKSLLVTLGIAKLGGDILNAGVGAKRMSETVKVMTKNLGISKETVAGWRKELDEANVTGINADNVLKSFMMTGLHTQVNFKDLSLMVKDFAAGSLDPMTGKAISSQQALALVTNSLVKMNDEGLRQLGVEMNLVSVFKKKGLALGKNATELTDVEKRMAILDEMTIMHEKSVKGLYKETYDTAGKSLSSMGDAFRTLQGNIGMIFEPALAKFFNTIRDNLKSVNKFFLENGDFTEKWGNRLVEWGEKAGEAINKAINRIVEDIKKWIEENGGVEATIEKVIKKIEEFAKKIADVAKWIYEHREALVKMWLAWKALEVFFATKTIVSGVFDVLGALKLYNKEAKGMGKINFNGLIVGTAIAIAINKVSEAIKEYNEQADLANEAKGEAVDMSQKWFDRVVEEKRVTEELIEEMQNKIDKMEEDGQITADEAENYQVYNDTLNEAKNKLVELQTEGEKAGNVLNSSLEIKDTEKITFSLEGVKLIWTNFIEVLGIKWREGWEAKLEYIDDWKERAINKFWEFNEPMIEWLGNFYVILGTWLLKTKNEWLTKWENMKQGAIELWNNITETLGNWLSGVYTKVVEWIGKVKEWIISKWNEIKNDWTTRMEEIKTMIDQKLNDILKFFEELPKNIKSAISSGMRGVYDEFVGWLGKMWEKAGEIAGEIHRKIQEAMDKDTKGSPSIAETIDETVNFVNKKMASFSVPKLHDEILEGLKVAGGNNSQVNNNVNVNAQVSDNLDITALSEQIAFRINSST